ncbi:hypothetical protein M6B38_114360 [Iris pallida]|uniref:Uncharacterized protein n=1 Tax=Iris pallida TaxID=29817 RepID=A0AAX6HI67_IRIPA|nr:hypothetical protein M6B38_312025 [Iris pallida]KAJ6853801.1 hypothetical protein M6B38_114360 [Iris pallida]
MPSGGVNYGYSADTNDIGVSGWSSGNKVGNISNTGVGTGNKVTTTGSAGWKGSSVGNVNNTGVGTENTVNNANPAPSKGFFAGWLFG